MTTANPQDTDLLQRISDLVDDEHTLRERLRSGDISADEEHERLADLEQMLDQCWDVLRQRRARRGAGEDPGQAKVRPPSQVENYRQ